MGWDPLLLSGEPSTSSWGCDVEVVQGLAYDRFLEPEVTPERIKHAVMDAFRRKWSGYPDVMHVHNPTLAKNRYLQAVLKDLQKEGMSILCQIHDFAEDGRPHAYYQTPYLENCHYAAINPRDRNLLLKAGLCKEGCHLLPNAVTIASTRPSDASRRSGVIYPVRAIRRKNIGEAILLSLFINMKGPVLITLPPNSPLDVMAYQFWKRFVGSYGLPVEFDA